MDCLCRAGEWQGGHGCLAQRRGPWGSRYKGAEAGSGVSPESAGQPAQQQPPSGPHPHRPGETRSPRRWLPAKPLHPPFPLPALLPDPSVASLLTSSQSPPQRCVRWPSACAPCCPMLSAPLATARIVPALGRSCLLAVSSFCPPAPKAVSSQGTAGSTPCCSTPCQCARVPEPGPGRCPEGVATGGRGSAEGPGRGRPGPDHFLSSGFLGKEEKVQAGQGQWCEPRREGAGGPPHHLRARVGGPQARTHLGRRLRQRW